MSVLQFTYAATSPPWHHHSHTHHHCNHPCWWLCHLQCRNNSPILLPHPPSAGTATHITVSITLTADTATGDSTATYSAGTIHTKTRHTDICILVNYDLQLSTTLRFLQGGSREKTLRTPQVKGDYIRNRVHSNQQWIMEER